MEKYLSRAVCLAGAVIFCVLFNGLANGQEAAIPRIISYQGQITPLSRGAGGVVENNLPLNGNHRVSVAFYSNIEGTDLIWKGEYETVVENGLFNILLGSGAYPLPEKLDRTIYVGVSIDGGKEMRPLSIMAGVPYALSVPDKSITKEKLATDYVSSIKVNGEKLTGQGSALNLKSGPGMLLDYDKPTNSLTLSAIGTDGLGNTTPQAGGDWTIGGDNIASGTPALGTLSGSTVKNWLIESGAKEILNFEDPGTGLNTNIRSNPSARIGSGKQGNVILSQFYNPSYIIYDIQGDYNFIGNGGEMVIYSNYSLLVGGAGNEIWDPASDYSMIVGGHESNTLGPSPNSVIVGGSYNIIGGTDLSGASSFIGGGGGNHVLTEHSSIVGGYEGNIFPGGDYSFIGGGYWNKTRATYTCVTGGTYNFIDTGSHLSAIVGGDSNNIYEFSLRSIIGGGRHNAIYTSLSGISSGDTNTIASNSEHSFIGGGRLNIAKSEYSTIAGGDTNLIDASSQKSFIGGGQFNKIKSSIGVISGGDTNLIETSSKRSFIGGGALNTIKSDVGGIASGENNIIFTSSDHSFIGGGKLNTDSSSFTVIGGGSANLTGSLADTSVIGGGRSNRIDGPLNVIGGGEANRISNGTVFGGSTAVAPGRHSFIGGGQFNIIEGNLNVIAGGDSNKIKADEFLSAYSFIGGGKWNLIDPGSNFNVIGGGLSNHNGGAISFIGSGDSNLIFDNSLRNVIGGGHKNYIGNQNRTPGGTGINYSIIGGGDTNSVMGTYSAILGGYYNNLYSTRSVITGGCDHIIKKESNYAFIGAGCGNYIHDTVTTIAGGESNTVLAFGGTIGGGAGNLVDAIDGRTHTNNNEAAYGSILGGQSNLITKHPTSEIAILPVGYNMPVYGTIGGGFFDTLCGHFGVIGGGMQNRAFGAFGTIPGGLGLKAYDWQTVIGLYNTEIKRLNNTSLTINLPIATDRLFVVGNGVSEGARSNAFEISQSGHSTVFEVAGNNSTGVQGGTYRDNTVEAWGECIQTNNVGPVFSFSTFGCTVTRVNTGIYRVTMNVLDPTTGASLTLTNISVTATLYMNGNIDGGGCYHIQVENKNTLIPSCQFDIHIKDQDCHDKDNSFMFHVTGR